MYRVSFYGYVLGVVLGIYTGCRFIDILLNTTIYNIYVICMGDGGFATNKIATARISVVYNCQLY